MIRLRSILFPGLLCASLWLTNGFALAQSPLSSLQPTQRPPEGLLAKRAVALYDYEISDSELEEIQRSFQRTGIDPIAWFHTDMVFSGKDAARAYGEYFVSRGVSMLVFLEKTDQGFHFAATTFNQKQTFVDPGAMAWTVNNPRLKDLLTTVLQDSWTAEKKANFLVNDKPETDIRVDIIPGRRQEFYAIDLKVDNLAVIKFGDETMDKQLEQFFIDNYPLKFKMVDAGSDELELRRKGFHYVLCFVHTRGQAAKEVLGYDMSKGEKSYASIAFPDGQLQLKILPRDQVVYKFYFRHIENGSVFLGTKWDADATWLDALRNHVLGFKQEVKIN